jgi:tape measure domain-containing protein
MTIGADIPVVFKAVGDEQVLEAVKKVTKNVSDLKRIAKTPIDLQVSKNSMPKDDFDRLKKTINSAKDVTKDWAKETEKLWREQQKLAAAAERAARAGKNIPSMAGITGSMTGGGGKAPLLPLGAGPVNTPLNPKDFGSKAIDDLNKSLGQVPAKARAAGEGLGFVGRIIAAMAIRSAIREVYEMANAFTAFQNKIKTVLKDQSDLNFVTNELIGIAQRSRQSLEAVGTIYTRTSRAVQALGKSQFETMKFTETLSKAVAVGGSTSIEAKNAMIQLSQGMSSGTLKGDELRSVLEQLPIVAELIAKKMGVAVGQLRKLGSEGKLTTDVVFSAITEATKDIDVAFSKMKPTMEQIVGVIKDKFMVAIGESSVLLGGATKALQLLSDNFDVAFKAAEAFSVIMLTLGTGNVIKMLYGFAAALGPVGIAIAAIATAGASLYVFGDQIHLNAEKTRTLNDGMRSLWEGIKEGASKSTQGLGELFDKTGKGFGIMGESILDFGQKISESAAKMDDFQGKMRMPTEGIREDLERTEKQAEKTAGAFSKLAKSYEDYAAKNPAAIIGEGVYTEADPRSAQLELGRQRDLAYRKWKEAQDAMNKKFNDFSKGNMPKDPNEMINLDPIKSKKDGKESGKSLEEVIREATFQEGASKMGDIEEKVKQRLHKAVESLKPSIKAAIEDIGGSKAMAAEQKRLEKLYDQNYEKFTSRGIVEQTVDRKMRERIALVKAEGDAIRAKARVIEELVTAEIHREEREKSLIERDKIILKQTEEGIKKAKELAEARKKMIEDTADRQSARAENMRSMATSLSPNFAIQQQITDFERFEQFAKQNKMADWAKLARERIEELKASMRWENTHFETFAGQMNSIFGPGGTLVKGFADAAANAIVMSESLSDLRSALVDVLNSVQKQALSSLIELPLNLAMGALGSSLAGAGGPTSFSTGTGGARSVGAAEAAGWGFASGGYTGNMGVNEPAGIVHGQEFVLNADATRRMGKQNLDMINKGATPVSASQAPMQVTVNNNAGVIVETNQLSPTQVEVMINKAIRDQTGRVVAGAINDPNSTVSRSLQKNLDNGRRRV